jgi:hypothetical protein
MVQSRVPLPLRDSDKSAKPDRPMVIHPRSQSLARTSLYHRNHRDKSPTKAMQRTRAILYYLSGITEPLSIRRIARELQLDQHSTSSYCHELHDLRLLYAVKDADVNESKPRFGISILGKLAAVALDSEEDYRHVNRNKLLAEVVQGIPHTAAEPFARFGQKLLAQILEFGGYDMVMHWAKFASRFVLQNNIDLVLAASWSSLPESLGYNQTVAFFYLVNYEMRSMEKDQFESVCNWLYQVAIFNRDYVEYMLSEYGSNGLERIRNLLELMKQWRAEDLDEANRNALLSSDTTARLLSQ